MKIIERTIRTSTLVSLPAILFLTFSPSEATARDYRASRGDFSSCASSLVADGVAGEAAAVACADALEPQQLSACVSDIQSNTEIAVEDALAGCYRVRRPEELSSCVIDISGNLEDAKPTAALDNCRRSLLPTRYADCTLGLQSNIPDLSVTEAMETCISAEYFPSEFYPQVE
ncbi:hypothetical protein [Myxosarcina sp. GI1]|uniref:hypothetical protein n=1 Tax=Myxosarcina sp. GI1 TaxID=1541065 RepID=UPI000562B144|nr:hypothetical protein [Myxosarcina sp. GI1]